MPTSAALPDAAPFGLALLPILALTLIVFMVTGLAMPVLPLHVHDHLGMGAVMVGLETGAQFAAALVSRLWSGHWLAFSGFSDAFVVARLFFGHLPDTLGGARVALACLLLEAAGQALIWMAPSPAFALAGAALTGFGYSLVYPGFGIEAVRAAPPESRGLAMGTYYRLPRYCIGNIRPCARVGAPVARGLHRFFLSARWPCWAQRRLRSGYASRLLS